MDAKLDLGYKTTQSADGTEVRFNGDGLGFWVVAIWGLMSAFFVMMFGIGVLMFGILAIGLWRRKKSQSFILAGDALIFKGLRYKYSEISDISLNLPDGKVYTNLSMAQTAGLMDVVSTGAAQRSFSISLRHGRKVIQIARFLSEDKAIAIYNLIAIRTRNHLSLASI